MNQENFEISNEDVEFFNTNCQDINDLDFLSLSLDFKIANVFLNTISLISNKEKQNQAIAPLQEQLTIINEKINFIKSDQSPFKPITDIFNNAKQIQILFSDLELSKIELATYGNSKIKLEDAVKYLQSIISHPDPFNNYDKINNFKTETFCECMEIVYNNINSLNINFHNDQKLNHIKSVFSECEELILTCPLNEEEPFYSLHAFLPYIINHEPIFKEYFHNFTDEYYKLLYNQFLKDVYKLEEYDRSDKDFIKKIPLVFPRHSKTIKMLLCYFSKNILRENFSRYEIEKIHEAIKNNLVRIFVSNIKITNKADYTNFTGTTYKNLLEYEHKLYVIPIEKKINELKEDDFIEYFNQKTICKIKKFEMYISSVLINKFNDLINSLKISKNKQTKYSSLIQLSVIIDSFYNDWKIDTLKEFSNSIHGYVSSIAFDKGREALDKIMGSTFQRFNYLYENGKANYQLNEVMSKYVEKLNDFKEAFGLVNEFQASSRFLSYKFASGLINRFLEIWKDKLRNLKEKIATEQNREGTDYTIQSCCHRFIDILYYGMKLEPTDYSIERSIFPINQSNGIKYLDIDILTDNSANYNIPEPKCCCYRDLLLIIKELNSE